MHISIRNIEKDMLSSGGGGVGGSFLNSFLFNSVAIYTTHARTYTHTHAHTHTHTRTHIYAYIL